MKFSGEIYHRLENQETSIFAVMSGLAVQHGAINLSQGFPDFEVSPELIELVAKYMRSGKNQYAPMAGVPELRKAIAEKTERCYGLWYNPEKEITVTAGATQAIHSIIAASVGPGDEVVIFEPAYDSYAPSVKMYGGVVRAVSLIPPAYRIDWEKVERLINPKTRMIIINSPHNPTGSVLEQDDLLKLQDLCEGTDILILSDEVYQHLIYDGIRHESVCRYPKLARRSFMVGSFGKTFHATGWKTGYVMAPENLTANFRSVHQFMVFAVNTPVQCAIAEYLQDPAHYDHLGEFYQKKRDYFLEKIVRSRFNPVPCHGTYFQLLDYSRITDKKEFDFARELTTQFGVAAIPVSSFYQNREEHHVLRFCFAKKEETLDKAAEILCRI
ncbi:MAG: pyridoxal phosphate-dependent aminotransferase [Bacteroidales bacterium]